MAGYIISLGADEYLDMFYSPSEKGQKGMEHSKAVAVRKAKQYALEKCISEGVYSARCSSSGVAFIGTLADYLGMKSGDDIYFFKERTIYGIGKLIDIENVDCRFRIYPKDRDEALVETKDPEMHQFICTFEPAPYFFKNGVDMDEVLMFCPEKIKSLRFFSKRTFMKLDDVESDAIKNVIARKNEQYLEGFSKENHYVFDKKNHEKIAKRLMKFKESYTLSVFDYIKYKNKKVASEYYLEGAILDLLRQEESKEIGKWNFVGRQYPASPPKPSEYEEAMDLFGYRYVPGFPGAISKYMVIELKAGTIKKENVQQTMKYVDWISREYAKGDYSMIEAFTVGLDKEENLDSQIKNIIERNFTIESRPVENKKWKNLRLISYCKILQELGSKAKRDSDE